MPSKICEFLKRKFSKVTKGHDNVAVGPPEYFGNTAIGNSALSHTPFTPERISCLGEGVDCPKCGWHEADLWPAKDEMQCQHCGYAGREAEFRPEKSGLGSKHDA